MELHSKCWEECLSKKVQEVRRGSFLQRLENCENWKELSSPQIVLKILEKLGKKHTLDIPVFNYPVFLTLYLLFFLYFCRNAFRWLCQEATNIIQESYMTNDRAVRQQNWNQYREATRNSVFQKKVLELFGENEDNDGNYIYKYSPIEECKIVPGTPAWIAENIRKLKEEKIRISNLNDWFLVCEGGEPIKFVMPKSTNDLSFKVLTTITGSGKGL